MLISPYSQVRPRSAASMVVDTFSTFMTMCALCPKLLDAFMNWDLSLYSNQITHMYMIRCQTTGVPLFLSHPNVLVACFHHQFDINEVFPAPYSTPLSPSA